MKLTKPTLLVDEEKTRRNIRTMMEKAARNRVTLRPHFKTHQSASIGAWFLEEGIDTATVSSVDMARYFADAGWKDLTIAFPYNPLEAAGIELLARRIQLNVLIVSGASLDHLNAHVEAPLSYFIKVDVGTHRTGIDPGDHEELSRLVQATKKGHPLKGLLAHAGHAYQPVTPEKAQEIFNDSIRSFEQVSSILDRQGLILSYGDTPTCTLLDAFPGVGELRPGNFVFYDTMQHSFGVCTLDDIAVCMACPVVAVHPSRNEAVVYGGAVHFSKDFIMEGDLRSYGTVVTLHGSGWGNTRMARVDRLSQEHGIIKGERDYINSLKPGDLVGILPVHSCLTADLQGYYVSLEGRRLDKLNKASL